jgi:hypothetical protein
LIDDSRLSFMVAVDGLTLLGGGLVPHFVEKKEADPHASKRKVLHFEPK